MGCTFGLSQYLTTSQRRFARITGLPLNLADSGRHVGLAAMLRIIARRALVHVSDERLLPGGGASWSSLDLALVDGAEARLPELLKPLKNGSRRAAPQPPAPAWRIPVRGALSVAR
jgi:hypothetical protein